MLYNPVAQSRRTRCQASSPNFLDDPEYSEESPVCSSAGDVNVDALDMISQRRKPRRRRSNLTKRLRRPKLKPSWDDCTIITPPQKPPRLDQALGPHRKRTFRKRCMPLYSCSAPRRSQGARGHTAKSGCMAGEWCTGIRPCWGFSPGNKHATCLRRRSQLTCVPSTNRNLHRKKTVVFHPEPVAYSQMYNPGKAFQLSKDKYGQSFGTVKETQWNWPMKKVKRPSWCASELCQPLSDKSLHDSVACVQPRDRRKFPCCNGNARNGQADPWKSDSGRLTTSESKAFRYLAQRLLEKDAQDTSPISPKHKQTFGKRDPSHRPGSYFESPVPNFSSLLSSDRTNGLQRRGRSKSRPSQKKYASDYTPRSKSLCNFKFNDGKKEFVPRYHSSSPEPVDACTTAMSNMQLKERELLDKYGIASEDSASDFGGNAGFSRHISNALTSSLWDPNLSSNDNCFGNKVSDRFQAAQCNDNNHLKKRHAWSPSRFERNVSQNWYSYGPSRGINPLGTANGFTRNYVPPSNIGANGALPWESVLQPRAATMPCAEVRLIQKYLDECGSSLFTQKRNSSPSRRESNGALEANNSQAECESKARHSTPPWRKVEGMKDYTRKDFKLDKEPEWKKSSGLSMGKTSRNFLGTRGRGLTGAYSSFSSDFPRMDRFLSTSSISEGGRKAADGRCGNMSRDQPGADARSVGARSKGLPSPPSNVCKFLNSDACSVQMSSHKASGKTGSALGDWQGGKAASASLRPVDSYLKEEEERLRRIGSILG
ncbi:hypothetical protein EGW08_017206 [Elysia chlorotica]|uniref:Uncharacterized protein n=1 Tax=Elysia chlorotica TaxID=188477 RepID=A0A433T0G1_ELYCH|nr:hypothetical protein EGW08_017206 [Elysia chlorotica]